MEIRSHLSGDYDETLVMAARAQLRKTWASCPAIVAASSSDGLTCSLMPALKARLQKSDGSVSFVNMPVLQDVPIVFPGGGNGDGTAGGLGVFMTFPILEGDEGIVIFSSRPIDTWFELGGVIGMPVQERVQVPIDERMHSLCDPMFIPGMRSKQRAFSGYSTTTMQIRTEDGLTLVEIDPANGKPVVTMRSRVQSGTDPAGNVSRSTASVRLSASESTDIEIRSERYDQTVAKAPGTKTGQAKQVKLQTGLIQLTDGNLTLSEELITQTDKGDGVPVTVPKLASLVITPGSITGSADKISWNKSGALASDSATAAQDYATGKIASSTKLSEDVAADNLKKNAPQLYPETVTVRGTFGHGTLDFGGEIPTVQYGTGTGIK